MMRRITILLIVVVAFSAFKSDELVTIRDLFYRAAKSEVAADSLMKKMKDIELSDGPVLMGYKSMSHFLACYHSYNPYTKYKYFLSGKELMESAIGKYPDNIELRFLRLTIQLNVPSFLGYSDKISEDKKVILANAKNIKDEDLYRRIYQYTITAKKLTEQEKKTLQLALKENKYCSK